MTGSWRGGNPIANDILKRAVGTLGLGARPPPPSSNDGNEAAAFQSAMPWLLAYTLRSRGIRVRGLLSSGGVSVVRGDGTATMLLSLFGLKHGHHHPSMGSLAAGALSSLF
jgi:hypothetical protein